MNSRIVLVLAGVVLLVTSFGYSDVIPGRWEKVDSLQAGSNVVVELVSGDRVEGELLSSAADALTIRDNGAARVIPKEAVSRVLVARRTGKHGALYGAAIGAGAGVATGLAVSSQFDETFFARADLMGLTCGAIGALTGAVIGNAAMKSDEREVVFRRN
jgi:hypothetical protein